MLQSLKFGVSAVTADGHDMGSLYRVIVDADTNRITSVTIQRGLIETGNLLKPGGWDKPRDVLVPINLLTGTDEGEVRLNLTEDEFLALPPYIIGDEPDPGGGWTAPDDRRAEDLAMRAGALLGGGVYRPPHDEQENRGPTERHLSRGAAVWRRAPHTHVGDIDRVLMDDIATTLSGLVVRRGVLFARDVVVPAGAVVDLLDDLVHVDLSGEQLGALEEYRDAP